MLHYFFSDPYFKQDPGNSLLLLISGLEAAWRLVESKNWPLWPVKRAVRWKHEILQHLLWLPETNPRQTDTYLFRDKGKWICLGERREWENFCDIFHFSWYSGLWGLQAFAVLCSSKRRISKAHHKAALLFSLRVHFISVRSFWERHSVCVWVTPTNNSHFDSWGMEANSFPDPKDTCFWYPVDLNYKQEGLCLLFSPQTGKQNESVNCNLMEWIKEEYELGIQEESWDSARQRWKWDTDGQGLIGFS